MLRSIGTLTFSCAPLGRRLHSHCVFLIIISFICLFSGSSHGAESEVVLVFSAPSPDVTTRARSGNIAHTAGALKALRKEHPDLVYIHGGGALGPSIHSNYDKGVHVIQLTNLLKPDAYNASRGDYAYGDDQISVRTREALFPIISANVIDTETGQAAEGVLPSVLFERGGVKVGIVGSTSETLMATFDVKYTDVLNLFESVSAEVKSLREDGAELIIVILSTGSPDIAEFRQAGVEVDVILQVDPSAVALGQVAGSTDFYVNPEAGEILVVKLSREQGEWRAENRRLLQTDYPQDETVLSFIEPITNRFERILNIPVATADVEFDTREPLVRSQESGFANLVADVLREETGADAAIINSGQIRGARVYEPGEQITRKDIQAELPFLDAVVMIEATGQQIIDALEHGVSKVEEFHGQFLQVSDLSYGYDSREPQGQRITFVNFNGEPLDPKAVLKVAMSKFLANGGDGFTMFRGATVLYSDQTLILWERVINSLRMRSEVSFQPTGRIEVAS